MMYVVTRCINEYHQDGEYFVTAFQSKPTEKQIMTVIGCNLEYAQHIISGGGRINTEPEWYYMHEIKAGDTL